MCGFDLTGVSSTMRDLAAATRVRVGTTPLLAIVVGVSTVTTWDLVGIEGTIANVLLSPRECATVGLRI